MLVEIQCNIVAAGIQDQPRTALRLGRDNLARSHHFNTLIESQLNIT